MSLKAVISDIMQNNELYRNSEQFATHKHLYYNQHYVK